MNTTPARTDPLRTDPLRTGRIVAALFLAQGVLAPIVNFALMRRINGPEGFLVNAAPHAAEVGFATLCLVAIAAMSVAIAIVVAPLIRAESRPPTLWLMVLSILVLALAAVEGVALLQFAAVSKSYLAAAQKEAFEPVRTALVAWRHGAHHLSLLFGGFFLLVFHASAFRYALLPKWLAGLGVLTVLLQIGAVLPALFGGRVSLNLVAPLGIVQLVLVAWLFVRGFRVSAARTRD